jgi:predicted GIY-YIG superfamily endonuclease
MVFIYILQLESNKYYIGKTNNPDVRLDSHFNSNGSEWTKLYKPIEVSEIISDCDSYDEDKYTLKQMEKYGIDNVRGGSFCQVELSEEQINLLNQMIKVETDKCFICGESGHFMNKCMESKIQEYLKDINNENIQSETIRINSIYEEIIELNRLINLTDFICIDDYFLIKKESQDMKKLNKLPSANHNYMIERDNDYRVKIRELNYLSRADCWRNKIHKIYPIIFSNGRTDKDIIILGLELIKFNLEKKRRLKEIYKKYYNEDFVVELLSRLHDKEIEKIISIDLY